MRPTDPKRPSAKSNSISRRRNPQLRPDHHPLAQGRRRDVRLHRGSFNPVLPRDGRRCCAQQPLFGGIAPLGLRGAFVFPLPGNSFRPATSYITASRRPAFARRPAMAILSALSIPRLSPFERDKPWRFHAPRPSDWLSRSSCYPRSDRPPSLIPPAPPRQRLQPRRHRPRWYGCGGPTGWFRFLTS